jgi:hypothetical protein
MKSYSQWCRRAGLETATAWVTTLVYDDRRTARDCIMLAVVMQSHLLHVTAQIPAAIPLAFLIKDTRPVLIDHHERKFWISFGATIESAPRRDR